MTGNGRTRFRTQPIGSALALLAGAVLLAACSSQTGAGATNPPAATSAPATGAGGGLQLTIRQNAALGGYVAGKDGKSLYVFEKDSAGTSACAGACATNWPPLTVASASDVTAGTGVSGAIGTIQRTDGTTQVTLGGKPLYYFAGDSAAGDANGQGLNNLWYLASPGGDPLGMAAASQPAATPPAASKCTSYCY